MQATEYMGCVYVYTIYSQLMFFFYAGMTVGISNVISIVADEIKTWVWLLMYAQKYPKYISKNIQKNPTSVQWI